MKVNKTSIREHVREVILRRIFDGTLQPGQRVVASDLAKELQVSNIPVREAIRELIAIGVLQSANHKGAWVRLATAAETIDALHVKAALEPKAVLQAGDSLQKRGHALRKITKDIVEAAKRKDFIAYQEHNQRFHRIIVKASGNHLLIKIWDSLGFEILTSFIMSCISEQQDPVAIANEHECIVDAIEASNLRKVCYLLAQHANNLVAYMEQKQGQEKGMSEDSEPCIPISF